MNPVLGIILGVVGLVIVAVAAYYVIRFMRGSIKLALPRTAFGPGETIAGRFELLVKKPVEGKRLVVSLIAKEIETYYSGGKRRRRTREVYRDEKVTEDARSYTPGRRATHEFEISAPAGGPSQLPPEVADNAVVQTIFGAAKALGAGRRRLKWRVEARLDARGVDLATSKKVTINLPSSL